MGRGIDYGMGLTNKGRDGIRFGVINMNALSCWAWESVENDYGDPTCGHCGGDVVEYDDEAHGEYEGRGCADYACEACERFYDSGDCYGDEPVGGTIDDDGLTAEVGSDGDVFVTDSPFFTRAAFCSPCAPGACHLENPCDDGERCFCFGHDWFDSGEAPYPVWDVETGERVYPDGKAPPDDDDDDDTDD